MSAPPVIRHTYPCPHPTCRATVLIVFDRDRAQAESYHGELPLLQAQLRHDDETRLDDEAWRQAEIAFAAVSGRAVGRLHYFGGPPALDFDAIATN